MNTISCIRRLFIAFSTIFGNKYLIIDIYIDFFSTLYVIKFFFDHSPMSSSLLNGSELFNDCSLLLITYSMFLFTDFIPDVELRYSLGMYFIYIIGIVFAINVSMVFYDMFMAVVKEYRKKKHAKKWKEYHQMRDKVVRFLIYQMK